MRKRILVLLVQTLKTLLNYVNRQVYCCSSSQTVSLDYSFEMWILRWGMDKDD